MFSVLKKGLIYNNISPDIVEHDLDIDADQWSYDGRDVYRGTIDPEYISQGLKVYWLYDDNLKRVGLTEHDAEDPSIFQSLWFYNNPFATLFQDESWKSMNKTLWSLLSNEAYQDCLETDFKLVSNQALSGSNLLITPEKLMHNPDLYICEKCGHKTYEKSSRCSNATISSLVFNSSNIYFLDNDFVLYEKTTDPQLQSDASLQEHSVLQPESANQPESQDAQSPLPENLPQEQE
jgi:hypothetical protein